MDLCVFVCPYSKEMHLAFPEPANEIQRAFLLVNNCLLNALTVESSFEQITFLFTTMRLPSCKP